MGVVEHRLRRWGLIVVMWMVLDVPSAGATWSVVGVDPQTQAVGVAIASCVGEPAGSELLPQAAAVVPGWGAMAAQANYNQNTRDAVFEGLIAGNDPTELLAQVVALDPGQASRQYGVVDLELRRATFTGVGNTDYAGDLIGDTFTVQGNILVGPAVLEAAKEAFETAELDCEATLEDRLLRALEAGSSVGGDQRCTPEQGGARAATLLMAHPTDSLDRPSLRIVIPSQPQWGPDPIVLLRSAYDAWRLDNPRSECATSSSSSSDGSDESSSSSGGESGSERSESEASSSGEVDVAMGTSGWGTESGGVDQQAGGGGCTVHPRSSSRQWLLFLFVFGVCRRAYLRHRYSRGTVGVRPR